MSNAINDPTDCAGECRGRYLPASLFSGFAGCLLFLVVGLGCAYWYIFDAESPLNQASSMACVYEWARLQAIPESAHNVSVTTRGSAFTREFTLTFDAPAQDVAAWLAASPGTAAIQPIVQPDGSQQYDITPGGGAAYASLTVSPDGTQVLVNTWWS